MFLYMFVQMASWIEMLFQVSISVYGILTTAATEILYKQMATYMEQLKQLNNPYHLSYIFKITMLRSQHKKIRLI